jgi:hypothetical protein
MDRMEKPEMDSEEGEMPVATVEVKIFADGTYVISSDGGEDDEEGIPADGGKMGGEEMSQAQTAPDFNAAMKIIRQLSDAAMGSSAQEAFDDAGAKPMMKNGYGQYLMKLIQ